MLTVSILREQREKVLEGYRKRMLNPETLSLVDKIVSLDDQRKTIQTKLDENLALGNQLSKQIGALYKSGEAEKANAIKQQVASMKEETKSLEQQFKSIKTDIENHLLNLPNVPHESVPAGNTEADNEVYKAWAKPLPDLGPHQVPHWDLAKQYNLIDLELGASITGSGFPLFRGKGAKLKRALINFFLDEAEEEGYEEIRPPFLVNEESAKATGQLPDKEGQMYHIQLDNLYLIPTGEVPLTNIFRDVILNESDFPLKVTGQTPCFRREAGSYGADVKGLNRVHQFDKVEIVQIQHPDKSYDALNEMMLHVEKLLVKLELPYRILRLCGGDLGFTSALTFDFEVYAAGQKKWLEVSSVSNFETFQANRMKLRYRDSSGKTQLAHTLNGSALALARIIAAILENNNTEEGIRVPEVLQKYLNFDLIN
jgi:seryl-tRNA synthetase